MNDDKQKVDAVFSASVGELKWILIAWVGSCLWVVGYCVAFGYEVDPENLQLVGGMPSWVFWGVLLPWIVATAFTVWFAMFGMIDQPLPERPDELDLSDPGDDDE